MKISRITIENFRAIKKLDLPLDPELTVLVGNNTAGKTTILDALAVGLGAILTRLPNVSGKKFRLSDIREELATELKDDQAPIQAPYTRVTLESAEGVIWDQTKKRDQTERTRQAIPPDKKLGELYHFLENIINDVQDGKPTNLPVIVYYGTDRAVLSSSLQRDFNKNFNRFKALDNALATTQRFQTMNEWFAFQEDIELRCQSKQRDFEYRLPVLESVRQAICQMMPGCSNPRTLLNPLRLIVTFEYQGGHQEKLSLNQLSDGYRTTLALVMDLARRMAQANPHLQEKAIQQSEAIVLIDEVDLHLHSIWQQQVLVDLMATFPKAQFIVTTHSAQVLTTIKPEHIVLLTREKDNVIAEQATSSYGAESGRLLVEIMGVNERPPAEKNKFTELLGKYYDLIESNQGESQEALKLRQELNQESPHDPILIKADMEIRRQRVLYGKHHEKG
jgi:predicted ATP-binding protein involved in virulence